MVEKLTCFHTTDHCIHLLRSWIQLSVIVDYMSPSVIMELGFGESEHSLPVQDTELNSSPPFLMTFNVQLLISAFYLISVYKIRVMV